VVRVCAWGGGMRSREETIPKATNIGPFIPLGRKERNKNKVHQSPPPATSPKVTTGQARGPPTTTMHAAVPGVSANPCTPLCLARSDCWRCSSAATSEEGAPLLGAARRRYGNTATRTVAVRTPYDTWGPAGLRRRVQEEGMGKRDEIGLGI
jgi:hypothetical protein